MNRLVPYLVLFLASLTVSTMLFEYSVSNAALPTLTEVSSSAVSRSASSNDIPTRVSNNLLANGDILGVNRLRDESCNVRLYNNCMRRST